MWDQQKYQRGFDVAEQVIATMGIDVARQRLTELPPPLDVNEYEVGFRSAIELTNERRAS